MLIYLCGDLLAIPENTLDILAASVEFAHTYSLIHDDLPAMDNDDLRRGKPTCHKAFDEATAILAGDALHTLAIDCLLTHLPRFLDAKTVLAITQTLTKAIGAEGMISGQALDLSELNKEEVTEAMLMEVHTLKTGQLFSACIAMTLKAGNPTAETSTILTQFAKTFGVLFQMQDDYLDRYGQSTHGKGRLSDLANEKKTFADLIPENTLRSALLTQYDALETLLSPLGDASMNLIKLLHRLKQRL